MKELILAGRKPGCSQHAPSKSNGGWGGGWKGPPSDSSVYWRGRQHGSWASKSQQTDSGDILIIPPRNDEASRHFFKPLRRPRLSNLHLPCRSPAAQRYHLSRFLAGQVNWGREATTGSCRRSRPESQFTRVTLHRHLGSEPPTLLTSLQRRGWEMTPSSLGQNTFGLVLLQKWDRRG